MTKTEKKINIKYKKCLVLFHFLISIDFNTTMLLKILSEMKIRFNSPLKLFISQE